MGSITRKINRNRAKKSKKRMKKQVGLFDKLPTECLSCQAAFDKNSKEHHQTWKVVVREKEQIVRLYCKECWTAAERAVEDVMEKTE
jgi:2-phospho-L-lactate transferase/gluconeogenesis factor (CofD/UPF0052 family)